MIYSIFSDSGEYTGYIDGEQEIIDQNGADNRVEKTLILGTGTHTFTANTGAYFNGGTAYMKNISVIGIIQ